MRGRGGRLANNSGVCTLVAVRYHSPCCWVLYPHGVGKLGVAPSEQDSASFAQGIAASDPLSPRSMQPCSSGFDLRCDPVGNGAVGAGLSSALSSPLSSAHRPNLALVLRHPPLIFEVPRRSRRSFLRSWTLGPVWRPVDLAQPDHTAAWGQPSTGPAPASYRSAPGQPCGSPQGRSMGCHTLRAHLPTQCWDRPSRRPAGVRGGERPQSVPSIPVSGLARRTNLRASDYQKPLPDSAGHDGTLSLTSSDTSRQYVLAPNVDGCFR
jgi:hypothetical protein